jgi:LysR family glycine cleavage system transcriptional activator
MFGKYLPPPQTLRGFEAAARLGSFTGATNELAVTQGAVSTSGTWSKGWNHRYFFPRLAELNRLLRLIVSPCMCDKA